jgi:hypothetical protein
MTKLWAKPWVNLWAKKLGQTMALAITLWFCLAGVALAGNLSDRLASYPQWSHPPKTQKAYGDLAYPAWFQGDWKATCTLAEAIAPQAPEVNSPGFAGNLTMLDKPVNFDVRFISRPAQRGSQAPALAAPVEIVSDRAYNGLNISRAYLGEDLVANVQVDPKNPNRQITTLRDQRQLISVIPARATEQPSPADFITTEIFQQVFRGTGNPYLNQVETTTAYHHQPEKDPPILADQITAVYLSPKDEDYFKVGDRPIAIYKYQLELRSRPS